MAGVRRLIGQVCIAQIRSTQEQLKFPVSPECIEISGHDNMLISLLDQLLEVRQLMLSVSELKRKMNDKDNDIFEFRLDDKPFYTFIKVFEVKINNFLVGEQGVGLLFENRYFLNN